MQGLLHPTLFQVSQGNLVLVKSSVHTSALLESPLVILHGLPAEMDCDFPLQGFSPSAMIYYPFVVDKLVNLSALPRLLFPSWLLDMTPERGASQSKRPACRPSPVLSWLDQGRSLTYSRMVHPPWQFAVNLGDLLSTWGRETDWISILLSQGLAEHICCCSVAQSRPTLFNPMDWSTPGFPVLHSLLELAQTPVFWVSDAIQWAHPLLSPSPPALNFSQYQGLFQWVGSLHQVAKVLELQLQHQSFQWIFQGWFPVGLTGLISLQSKGLSRVFSNNTVQKHQFFSTQLSL